jgi:DNA-binding response OmpR family regulator
MTSTTERPDVLSVEDDERIQRLIRTVLQTEGYNVITANDGAEALDLLGRARPSVILLDLMMPGVDGWEFMRRIREMGLEVPVVLVSAVRDLPVEAKRLGATDALPKPFDVDELVDKVEAYLSANRA